MNRIYRILYLNNYDYVAEFTGIIVKNKPDRLLIDVNGENHKLEIFKKNIIEFKFLKTKKVF